MKVTVQYYALIREFLNKETEEVEITDGSTLKELVDFLINKYGEDLRDMLFEKDGSIAHRIMMLVDGHEADLSKGDTFQFRPNSRIQFFQPIGGG
jgi:molybdopterin converting factor small subunit